MRNIISIARREILSFFVSPVAYFVITGFVLLAGYFFINYLMAFNNDVAAYNANPAIYRNVNPNLNQWVIQGFYQTLVIILVFLVPLITMRTMAEEKKRGTFELLATSPVSVFEIVVGKYLGVAFVILVMMAAVLFYPLMLCYFGNPEVPPIFSGILSITLCALAFASIGMAVSSFTENQIVAGISSMVTLLLFYVIHSPAQSMTGLGRELLMNISPVMQLKDMLIGVITLKSIVYFLSLIALGLFLSQRALDSQRWR